MNWNLIIKFLTNSATDKEKTEFRQWLHQSEKNRILYKEVKQYWDSSENAFNNFNPDLFRAWQNINKETLQKDHEQYKKHWIFSRVMKIAAAIVVFFILTYTIAMYSGVRIPWNRGELTSYSSMNEVKVITLKDSTKVWLNSNSSLEVFNNINKKDRRVLLTGEAFFEVVKNPGKPFLVKSGNTTTEVLGTSFNLNSIEKEEIIHLTVTTGKVAFYKTNRKSREIILLPGETATYDPDNKALIKYRNENLNYLSWKTGVLKFENTPLNDVIRDIKKYYNINIDINHSIADDYSLTGTFENEPLDNVLKIIEKTLDISFVKQQDKITVYF